MRRPCAIAAAVVLLAGASGRPRAAGADPSSLPIPISPADLAAAAGLQRDDPSTLGLDLVRLAFAAPDGNNNGEAEARQAIARALTSTGQPSRMPLPLAMTTWRSRVLRLNVADDRLAAAVFGTRASALLYYGLMGMDPPTLAWIDANPSVLDDMLRHPGITAAFARSIRLRDGAIVTPGERTEDLWAALVEADPRQPANFIAKLLGSRNGRTAMLYDAVAHLDAPHQRFALGAPDAADRRGRARRLLDAVGRESPGWQVDERPFMRADVDVGLLLRLVAVDETGAMRGPASRHVWGRIFDVRDGGDGAVDAAWLAAAVLDAGGSARRRLDTLLFAQRALSSDQAASRDALVDAIEAFKRYPILMLTLENNGVDTAAAYAAAGRAAEAAGRDEDALGVFQACVAIADLARRATTIPPATARTLFASLSNAATSRPMRASLLRWVKQEFLPALGDPQPVPDMEAAVLGAIAGPASGARPAVAWEGQRYVVDLAATELRRLARVRNEQAEDRLDKAIAASNARSLAPLARSLAGIVYASAIGEPDSAAVNGGPVWRRHRFTPDAAGQPDTGVAWRLATEVFGAGGWHLVGSLLRLDVALAHLSLRRLDATEMPAPSLLSTTDRRTLAISVALIDPRSIDDAERDAVASAIARGRERVATLRDHPAQLAAFAADAAISEWRENALRWLLAVEPSRVTSVVTTLELFRLGGDPRSRSWGAASVPLDGCLCLRMPDRTAWEELTGRASTGQLATQLADVMLRSAEALSARHLPAALLRDVAAFAMQDVIDRARPGYFDDWLPVAFAARDLGDDRFDDYVAALTAAGPLLPAAKRSIQ
jgi:hypothetical protein